MGGLNTVFNTAMHFKNVKFTDEIRIELKVNRNLAENILLFQTFIRMDELVKLTSPHPVETKFEITLQAARADEKDPKDQRESTHLKDLKDLKDQKEPSTAGLLCCFDIDPKVPPDLPDHETAAESTARTKTPGFSTQPAGHQFTYSKRTSVSSIGTEFSDDFNFEEDSNAFDPAFLSVRRDFACLMLDSDITVSNDPVIEKPIPTPSKLL